MSSREIVPLIDILIVGECRHNHASHFAGGWTCSENIEPVVLTIPKYAHLFKQRRIVKTRVYNTRTSLALTILDVTLLIDMSRCNCRLLMELTLECQRVVLDIAIYASVCQIWLYECSTFG